MNLMNRNLFLLMEQYIAKPSTNLAKRIKQLSHDLTNQAYEAAKIQFPKKVSIDHMGRVKPKIGADDYSPILLDTIQTQAKEAFTFSTRMHQNQRFEDQFYATERTYLFKLSQTEKTAIHQLLIEMTRQDGTASLRPEGLIFAYDAYVERQNKGRFGYAEGKEAAVYEHNTRMYLKAMELVQRGEVNAAVVLTAGCEQIKAIMVSADSEDAKYSKIKKVLVGLQNDPTIQENRGIIKSVILNFVIMITFVGAVYLATTAYSRGTFFYQPNTNTRNIANDFERVLDKPAPEPMRANLD